MLEIRNLSAGVILKNKFKETLENVNLTLNTGETLLLKGKNGSGKSSLLNILMGLSNYQVSEGIIKYQNQDLLQKNITERSQLGIFLANQHPLEVPGVSLFEFLRLIYQKRLNTKVPVFKFRKILDEKLANFEYPIELLNRNLNEGFSGGEKKKTEILQMIILEPKLILLDEIDSGLDEESVLSVFNLLKEYKELNNQTSMIVVSHYPNFQNFFKPDIIKTINKGILD